MSIYPDCSESATLSDRARYTGHAFSEDYARSSRKSADIKFGPSASRGARHQVLPAGAVINPLSGGNSNAKNVAVDRGSRRAAAFHRMLLWPENIRGCP